MKRAHNRMLRHSAEMNPVAPHDGNYTGKHESLVDSIAEIFDELCEALDITAEFIAETVAESRARIRKIAGKLRLPKLPEAFHGYRWRNYGDLGLFDIPIIAEGGGKYDVAWNWRG